MGMGGQQLWQAGAGTQLRQEQEHAHQTGPAKWSEVREGPLRKSHLCCLDKRRTSLHMVGYLAAVTALNCPLEVTSDPHTPTLPTAGDEGSGMPLDTVVMATSPPPDLSSDCVKLSRM